MASVRRLPSGRWQVSVLMDDGTRTTKTLDSQASAATWGIKLEVERDRIREEKKVLNDDQLTTALLASLQELADQGRLTAQHRTRLAVIIDTVK